MTNIGDALGNNPELDCEILLCHVLNKNRAYLFAHPEVMLTQEQFDAYQHLLSKRLEGVPIAYLTGEREFWSLNLKVNEHTLIPRHETELLVELALEKIHDSAETCVLELGTGSGAIALALAKEKPHWQIIACDINEKTLLVAKENASFHQLNNISFYHSDWFKKIPQRQYHAIISNPPYIAEGDHHLREGDLRFEPQRALVSGQNGLADLQWISEEGYNYLSPHGLLLLEHGYNQKINVQAILNKLGYKNVQTWQDMQNQDRVTAGMR